MSRQPRRKVGRQRAASQARHVGDEIRLARTSLGLSHRRLARIAGVATSTVVRVERGAAGVQLDTLVAIGAAAGVDVVVRAYPGAAPRLRDSGQLAIADTLRAQAAPRWQARLEVPAGQFGRSADLVLFGPDEILHLEIERMASDFQAQYRSAVAKREALAASHARPVRLVVAVVDTVQNRAATGPHLDLIRQQLPAGSREVLKSIRTGATLGRDAFLWVRPRMRATPPPDRSIGTTRS